MPIHLFLGAIKGLTIRASRAKLLTILEYIRFDRHHVAEIDEKDLIETIPAKKLQNWKLHLTH